ncbi:MAG: hypothetical protein ACRDGM_05855, partial [bacterium]
WMGSELLMAIGSVFNAGLTQASAVLENISKHYIGAVVSPSLPNPFTYGAYVTPVGPCLPEGTTDPGGCAGPALSPGDQTTYSTWAYYAQALGTVNGTLTAWTNDSDTTFGYSRLLLAAIAFAQPYTDDFGSTGRRAWDFMQASIRFRSSDSGNPFHVMIPTSQVYLTPKCFAATSTTANCSVVRPLWASSGVWAANPATTLTSGYTSLSFGNGNKLIAWTATGLTAASVNYVVVDLGNARGVASVTTP